MKTAALIWAALEVSGLTAGHLCYLLQKISPCGKTLFDVINPSIRKNMFHRYIKTVPWLIIFASVLGYTNEFFKKRIKKRKTVEKK